MVKVAILVTVLMASLALAGSKSEFVRMTSGDLQWEQLEPGLDMAVLEGDPRGEGYYILRARFQPGTFSAPHFHPNTRYVTVIEGTWWTGTGAIWDKDNAVPLGPGSYMKHPAGAAHYDGAKDEQVIVEIHGIAPAPLVYVDETGKPVK